MTTPADYPYPYGNGLGYTPVVQRRTIRSRMWFWPLAILMFLVGTALLLAIFVPNTNSVEVQPTEVTHVSELLLTTSSNDIGAQPLVDVPPN